MTLVERKDLGKAEWIAWYTEGGRERERRASARHVIRYERRDREPLVLCEGEMTWGDAYHYFAGLGVGFGIALRAHRAGR